MGWKFTAAPKADLPELRDGMPAGERVERLVDRPTVTVDVLRGADDALVVCKRYFFPTLGSRLRGILRHTGFGTPKPTREFENLVRLQSAGADVAAPIASAVRRDLLQLVTDGWVLVAFEEGDTLERLLLGERPPAADAWRAIGASVRTIHDAGCWYRNLCARNLMVGPAGRLAWIDPAKSRWQNGPVHETHALVDLIVLLDPVEPWMPDGSWEASFEGYGRWPGVRNAKDLLTLLPPITHSSVRGTLLRERKRLGRI